jgi:hypothetical protein
VRFAIAALLLLAAVAPAAGAPWLSRAARPQRVPRAGIAAWMACSLAVLVSLILAGLILAVPGIQLSTDPATLRACLSLLRAQCASPAAAVTGTAGVLLAAAVGGPVPPQTCGSSTATGRPCTACPAAAGSCSRPAR